MQKRQCDAAVFISTHAPAGGATLTSFLPRCLIHLFLLTPLREGRHCRQALAEHNHEFLLTPLREGRRARRGRCCRKGKISTHAPAGGATRPSCLLVKRSGNFYSRPCGRGDRRHSFGVSAPRSFLLTPLREGRRFQRDGGAGVYVISTHAPAGGATTSDLPSHVGHVLFLLTPLREGRRVPHKRGYMEKIYFYSRPCGRGDRARRSLLLRPTISTHAPAGGATLAQAAKCSVWIISTHAPAGGATGGSTRYICSASISTHAPAGGATHLPHDLRQSALISTHAPAGGATSCSRCCSSTDSHFYSRPCGRGDVDGALDRKNLPNFYSRPCGRGDFPVLFQNQGNPLFLLTPLREGRLPRLRDHLCSDCISTHAPAGGATKQHSCQRLAVNISTHAPAGGATPTIQISAKSALISTHAPAGGATSCSRCCSSTDSHFYSRPCGRGDTWTLFSEA